MANLSSQDVAVGSAINVEGAEPGAAGARELVAVPFEVVERGVDGAAGGTDRFVTTLSQYTRAKMVHNWGKVVITWRWRR